MKKFSFSLEKALDVKIIEEKVLQKELSIFLNDLYKAEDVEKNIETEIECEFHKKELLTHRIVSSSEVMTIHNYIQSLEKELLQIQQSIIKIKEEIEKIRMKLLEKSKEKKTLEKLREMKMDAYKKEIKKLEQEFIDEISGQSHHANALQEVL